MPSGSPPGVPIALNDALEDADTMGVLIADFGRFFGCAFGYAFMRGGLTAGGLTAGGLSCGTIRGFVPKGVTSGYLSLSSFSAS